MRSTFLSRALKYQRASGVHEQQQIDTATVVPEHPMVNPTSQKSFQTCSHGGKYALAVSFPVGHQRHHQMRSLLCCSELVSVVVEMTSFESSSSVLAHNPDNFAGVHCRPPELALLEEAGRLRPGQTCSSSASLRLSSTCAPSTSDTTCSTSGGIGRLTNCFLFFTS